MVKLYKVLFFALSCMSFRMYGSSDQVKDLVANLQNQVDGKAVPKKRGQASKIAVADLFPKSVVQVDAQMPLRSRSASPVVESSNSLMSRPVSPASNATSGSMVLIESEGVSSIAHGIDMNTKSNDVSAGATLTAENLATVQASGMLTKAWYGVSKKLGLTATQTLFELNDNGTLKADALANPEEALRRVVDAIGERYSKDLTLQNNQEKIGKIFSIIEATKKVTKVELELTKALAKKYNELQATALEKVLHDQATVYQPIYQEEKEEAIQVANQIYATKMLSIATFAAQTAKNKRYLELQLTGSVPFEYAKKEHYQNAKTHEVLLASIRQELSQKSISDAAK